MSDKVAKLESHIKMLETENKWLKDLITDKNQHWLREDKVKTLTQWKHQKQKLSSEQKRDGVETDVKS